MKKFSLTSIMVLALTLSCGTGFLSSQNVSMLVETGMELMVGHVVADEVKDGSVKSHQMWSSVVNIFDDVILPLIKGDTPSIRELEQLINSPETWAKTNITNRQMRMLQRAINLTLSYIPVDKWKTALEEDQMFADTHRVFQSAFTAFRNSIADVLEQYPLQETDRDLKITDPANYTLRVILNYKK